MFLFPVKEEEGEKIDRTVVDEPTTKLLLALVPIVLWLVTAVLLP